MYETGQGVTQDETVAVTWFRRSAEHGNPAGQSNLGIMYAHGRGVPLDYAEARKWFQLAADHGNVSAMNNLGVLHATGKGVAQSYDEASKWYHRAADHGDANARQIAEKIDSNQARERELSRRVDQDARKVQSASTQSERLPIAHDAGLSSQNRLSNDSAAQRREDIPRIQPRDLEERRVPMDPSVFRFSSPLREERNVNFAGPPGGGFRSTAFHSMSMGGGHFGRR